ncbi:Uncharacterized conserved protein YafD, endonuclease/exonuclease/phosphatase (EEP) superfamily [Loktanella atrilutea]|uniref:Uncharacterized conserved protein YafD, endonuclease/exonuclease/phosphatase (EEP) superfamily n=2 Tax=Loktanella atrilutea TaxID=366533 RepID=A0A1M5F582_LOKAT|nr:Uncharacterized conserved protein YafD, endonuclease/exonuclease/phosphatase (EEP) superfamily [Loktanella atrilutea]
MLGLIAVLCLLTGATASYWPDSGFLGTFGRMCDSLAPQLLGGGLLLALGLALLGVWQLAMVLAVLALAAGGTLARDYVSLSAPAGDTAAEGLTVIWFNLFAENTTPAAQIADAILSSGADLVVLAEAAPFLPALPRLADRYPYRLGCTDKVCSTLVLSRLPFGPDSAGMIAATRPGRIAAFQLAPDGRAPLTVVAAHLTKPWYYGFYDVDLWHLMDQSRKAAGPLLVMGDFNTAPWSHPMQRIIAATGLRLPHRPVATWPAAAGPLGVPLDHMLVGGGAALTGLAPWGGDLGSNHRGLTTRVVWPTNPETGSFLKDGPVLHSAALPPT